MKSNLNQTLRLVPVLIAGILSCLASCKKKDSSDDVQQATPVLRQNTFIVGNELFETRHSGFGPGFSGISLTAQSTMYNSNISRNFFVEFMEQPQSDGEYNIVGDLTNDQEVTVATNFTNYNEYTAYRSTGHEQMKIKVTIANGKAHVIVPMVWAKKLTGPGPDSVQLAADILEE